LWDIYVFALKANMTWYARFHFKNIRLTNILSGKYAYVDDILPCIAKAMIRMQDVGSLYLADKAPILYIHT